MPNPITMVAGSLCLFLLALTTDNAQAEDGKELFQKQCASCHTIGGGDSVGPDLKGVASRRPADWIVRVIVEPDKLAAEKDPTQVGLIKKYGMEMPKLGVSREDAQKIVTFLQGGAAPAKGEAAPAAPPPAAAPVVPTRELLQTGRDLFTGKTRFSKGGAPCVSCHNLRYPGIYGGALAADLTGVYAGMGESGMRGVLKSLSFPVMRRIYADRPLSEPETTALLALFQDAAARQRREGVSGAPAQQPGEANPFPLTGLACFAAFIIAAAVYQRRTR